VKVEHGKLLPKNMVREPQPGSGRAEAPCAGPQAASRSAFNLLYGDTSNLLQAKKITQPEPPAVVAQNQCGSEMTGWRPGSGKKLDLGKHKADSCDCTCMAAFIAP
jgi:hypothetical protein